MNSKTDSLKQEGDARFAEGVERLYVGEKGEEYAAAVLQTDEHLQEFMARERVRKLQPLISSSDSVLEIGVAYGTNLHFLQCAKKVGSDVGDFGKEACTKLGIEFHTGTDDFDDASFSVVLLHHVLEHVPSPDSLLTTALRILEPGGRLLIFVPYERGGSYQAEDPNHHLYSWTPQTLGNLVTAVGYELHEARFGPFGYERALAPLARFGMPVYRMGLMGARLVRPVREVIVVAHKSRQ